MQVKLEKTFLLHADAETAWSLLQDIPSATECVPGAKVTERIDATHYKGQLRFRLGPVSATFDGSVEVKDIVPEERRIHILGKGSDATGTSAASMDLTAFIRPTGVGQCEIVGVSAISISGKMVAFGGRMIDQVADQLLGQFGDNFARKFAVVAPSAAAAAAEVSQPREFNVLALIWNIIVGLFKKLFGGKKT